jgi:hypothetical protein
MRAMQPRNPAARPAGVTPDDKPLPTAPDFPDPPRHAESWTRRPYANLLPDRWVVAGYTDTAKIFTAVGATIPDKLTAGPSPDDDGPAPPPGGTDALQVIDADMRWLIDFNAALANGMAVRVPLAAGVPTAFARLIVVGLRSTLDADESVQALSDLFDAHHFTSGLSLVRRGTPTNNTDDAPSGYGSSDPGYARSFAAETRGPLFAPGSGAAGDVASRAFGVDTTVFANSQWAAEPIEPAAQAMSTALWPGTWGYFLEHRLAGVVSDQELADVRAHFIRHVRGGGPLPSLRVGKQPYGLLPVTSLDLWKPLDDSDLGARPVAVLQNLRAAFRRALVNVPRVGATSDPDQDLLSVLRMEANSSRYAVRHMLGAMYANNFWAFAGAPLDASWWQAQAAAAASAVAVPGLPANTPQSVSVYTSTARQLDDKPLVQSGPPSADGAPAPSYIAALAAANVATLRANTIVPAGQRTMLYDLLRHGLLLAYGTAGYRMLLRAGLATPADRLEPELIDIVPDQQTATVWRQLERTIPAVTGTQTVREYLDDPAHETNPDAAELADMRRSLRALAGYGRDRLELLFPETLDVASHRFDAWATSLATRRLDAVRTRKPKGAIVGGYGWIENLAPAQAPTSDGYIHTPSATHAVAAAILASGYLTHRGAGSQNPFAIDLSSERVRLANRLMQGVRQGQTLAALLGYELERALQDERLSPYVARFRKLAPLPSTPTAPQEISEAVGANNVVHGQRILTMWATKDPLFQALRTPANVDDFKKIDAIFRRIDGLVDALGDVLIANSVYQVAQGNFNRTGLTLDGVLQGLPLPEQEVIHTSRTGTTLMHRVLATIDASSVATPAWTTNLFQARASAERCLNAWVAKQLPDPAKVTCRATYGAGGTPRVVALSELELSPLDAVLIEAAELQQRLIYHLVATRPAGIAEDAAITVNTARDPAARGVLSFDEFIAAAGAVRATLAVARPLTAADLVVPEENGNSAIDAGELRARGDAAVAALRSAHDALTQLIANAAGAPADQMSTALMRAAHFGLAGAVPQPRRLADQVKAAEADVAARLSKVDDLTSAFNRAAAAPAAVLDFETNRLRAVFGPNFTVLPRFTVVNADELRIAFGASDALLANRKLEAVSWFTRACLARDRLVRLSDVLRFEEMLLGTVAKFTVGQLPFVAGDSWIGLPNRAGAESAGKLSLVACGPLQVAANRPVAGLVFDEWSEVIPRARETTGLALHYDRPSSRPPQAVLVAAAPDMTRPWGLDTLEAILLETLELGKLRLVDQDAMAELDHFLPALTFAINAADDTVTADLRVR